VASHINLQQHEFESAGKVLQVYEMFGKQLEEGPGALKVRARTSCGSKPYRTMLMLSNARKRVAIRSLVPSVCARRRSQGRERQEGHLLLVQRLDRTPPHHHITASKAGDLLAAGACAYSSCSAFRCSFATSTSSRRLSTSETCRSSSTRRRSRSTPVTEPPTRRSQLATQTTPKRGFVMYVHRRLELRLSLFSSHHCASCCTSP